MKLASLPQTRILASKKTMAVFVEEAVPIKPKPASLLSHIACGDTTLVGAQFVARFVAKTSSRITKEQNKEDDESVHQ